MKISLAAAGLAGVALTAQVNAGKTTEPTNVAVAKGDKLQVSSCADATWPNIPADCLTFVKGDASAEHVVTYVTVARQTGANETTLTRVPRTKMASY